MAKYFIVAFALTLVAAALAVVGSVRPLVPQGLFALALIVALLAVMNQRDEKRL